MLNYITWEACELGSENKLKTAAHDSIISEHCLSSQMNLPLCDLRAESWRWWMEYSVWWMGGGEREGMFGTEAAIGVLAWDLLPAWAGLRCSALIWPCLLPWYACRINARFAFIHLTLCLPLPPLYRSLYPHHYTQRCVKLEKETERVKRGGIL